MNPKSFQFPFCLHWWRTLWPEPTRRRKGFVWSTFLWHNPFWREVRAGTQADTMKGMLFDGPFPRVLILMLCYLLCTVKFTCPDNGMTHSGLDSPTSITYQDNFLEDIQTDPIKTIIQLRLNSEVILDPHLYLGISVSNRWEDICLL